MNKAYLGFLFVPFAALGCSSDDSSIQDASTTDQSVADVVSDTSTKDATADVGDASDASSDVTDGGSNEASSDASDASDGSVTACHTCSQSSCTSQISACTQSALCTQWLQCVNNCTAPSCESACDAQYPTAATLFDVIYSCSCTNCNPQCGNNLAPCTHGQDGGA